MAGDLKQRLNRLESKAELLARTYAQLIESRNAAEAKIAELTALCDSYRKEIDRLSTEVEYLKMAHTVAPTRSDVAATRAMLAELVRDIDRCIADIGD
ncbi:MAG: hypothetical protein K2I18_09610 [Paramuribaculum sp.]|nr:hypothetical protein [Paramuribaculum sp.]